MSFDGLSVNFSLVDRGKASLLFSVDRSNFFLCRMKDLSLINSRLYLSMMVTVSGWSDAVVVLRCRLATVNGVSGVFFIFVESVISSTSSLKRVRLGDDLVTSGAILVLSLSLDLDLSQQSRND